MNRKTSKRALGLSFVSLLLCFTMLMGTTFAWFTDNASVSVNTIQSGTLRVDLVDANEDSLEGKSLVFKKAGDNELWEPGQTWTLQDVYVKNNGNLALKYRITITGIQGDAELNKAITWTIKVGDETVNLNNGVSQDFKLAANTKSPLLSISGTMDQNAGNEYQGKKIEGISIKVEATQDTVEHDSVNNIYDANAQYGVDFEDGNGGDVPGDDGVTPLVFNETATYTVEGIKANGSNGVLQSTAGTLTIKGSGTVNAEEADDGYAMAVWANGGNVVIEGGNFEQTTDGSDATYDLIYASNGGNITIKGGTFKSATPAWTLNVKDADRATSHITVMGGKFYQFDPSNAQTGEGEISVHEDYKVVKNGDWYEVVERMEYTTIDSLKDFVDFANAVTANTPYKGYQIANNKYITASLTTNIDLAGVAGPTANTNQFAIGNGSNTSYCGTFDGQGHTISNHTVTGIWSQTRALFRTVGDGFTMKNITFDNCKTVSGTGTPTQKTGGAAIVVGGMSGNVAFDTVTVKNSHVEGNRSSAVLVGFANQGFLTVTNCTIDNVDIISGADAGVYIAKVNLHYGDSGVAVSGNTVNDVTWTDAENADKTSELNGYLIYANNSDKVGVAYDINGNAK